MSKWMYFVGGLLTAGIGMAAYAVYEDENSYTRNSIDDEMGITDEADGEMNFADDSIVNANDETVSAESV